MTMEATIINLLAVMIIGNLALMGAIPIIGILWFAFGDIIMKFEQEREKK